MALQNSKIHLANTTRQVVMSPSSVALEKYRTHDTVMSEGDKTIAADRNTCFHDRAVLFEEILVEFRESRLSVQDTATSTEEKHNVVIFNWCNDYII